ncbi:peptidoglycan-recognition protein SC2-like [Onthophagus taurus]|uniref:peptidoglycan-recognition protein SC2-like n=1 Tax=Onthophagus taurus TaxID=166361 RepID=UPI0039BDD924
MLTKILLIYLFTSTQTLALNIISRTQWLAKPSKTNQLLAINPPSHVVIHHAGTTNYKCSNVAECSLGVRKIQTYHMNGNGWKDIGYNFLVGQDGNVYEGRGWGKHGAHSPGFNRKSIGICFIGDYSNNIPSQQQINTAKELIKYGVDNNLIKSDYKLVGHRQDVSVNTACPGQKLFDEIKQWDHYTMNP